MELQAPESSSAPARFRVLVIDDNALIVETLRALLMRDYEVSTALSGRQALTLLAEGLRPDLILLDVMMPNMDGYEVCVTLKRSIELQDIPVIFVTARTDPGSESRALDAGGADFVTKPVNADVLRARIKVHLQIAVAQQKLAGAERKLKQALSNVQLAEGRLRMLSTAFEQMPTTVMVADAAGLITHVSARFTEETGYSPEEALGQDFSMLSAELSDELTLSVMRMHISRGEAWHGELINRRKSGSVYWVATHFAPITDARGKVTHFVIVQLDITERKETEARLRNLPQLDAVTGIPNRALFEDRTLKALQLVRRYKKSAALMYVDLQHFRLIIDQHGMAVANGVLRSVAERIGTALRAGDSVGRIDGDEFLVLLAEVRDGAAALMVGEKIRIALNQPFEVDEQVIFVTSGIGIALYPEHGDDVITLVRNAVTALTVAKRSGLEAVRLYAPS